MTVNGKIDAGLNDAGIDLDELDKKATKALKALQKEQKAVGAAIREAAKSKRERDRLSGRGGIFGQDGGQAVPTGSGAPTDIAKNRQSIDEIIDKKIQVGISEAFAGQSGGVSGAQNIFSMAKNPKAFVSGVAKSIPFLGGLVHAAEFGQAILTELEKLSRFLNKFIDNRIDTRENQLREREESAHISAGDIQEILTTQAGGSSPREAYNTYNEFNENRSKLEADYAVRNKSGV